MGKGGSVQRDHTDLKKEKKEEKGSLVVVHGCRGGFTV